MSDSETHAISSDEAYASFLTLMDFVDTLPSASQEEFHDLLRDWWRTDADEDRQKLRRMIQSIFNREADREIRASTPTPEMPFDDGKY